jgi:hypothetical protein
MYENLLFLGHGNTMQASEAFVQQPFGVMAGSVLRRSRSFGMVKIDTFAKHENVSDNF